MEEERDYYSIQSTDLCPGQIKRLTSNETATFLSELTKIMLDRELYPTKHLTPTLVTYVRLLYTDACTVMRMCNIYRLERGATEYPCALLSQFVGLITATLLKAFIEGGTVDIEVLSKVSFLLSLRQEMTGMEGLLLRTRDLYRQFVAWYDKNGVGDEQQPRQEKPLLMFSAGGTVCALVWRTFSLHVCATDKFDVEVWGTYHEPAHGRNSFSTKEEAFDSVVLLLKRYQVTDSNATREPNIEWPTSNQWRCAVTSPDHSDSLCRLLVRVGCLFDVGTDSVTIHCYRPHYDLLVGVFGLPLVAVVV
jgi:hypothetical protein